MGDGARRAAASSSRVMIIVNPGIVIGGCDNQMDDCFMQSTSRQAEQEQAGSMFSASERLLQYCYIGYILCSCGP